MVQLVVGIPLKLQDTELLVMVRNQHHLEQQLVQPIAFFGYQAIKYYDGKTFTVHDEIKHNYNAQKARYGL